MEAKGHHGAIDSAEFAEGMRAYVEAAGGITPALGDHAARVARMTCQCCDRLPPECRTLLDLRTVVDARFATFSAALDRCASEIPSVLRFVKICAVMAQAIRCSTDHGDGTVMLSDCLSRGYSLLAQNPFLHAGRLRTATAVDVQKMVAAYAGLTDAFRALNATIGNCFEIGTMTVFSQAVTDRLKGLTGEALICRLLFDGSEERRLFTPLCLNELASGIAYMGLASYTDEMLATVPLKRDEAWFYDFCLFMLVVSRSAATSNALQFRRNLARALAAVRGGTTPVTGPVTKGPVAKGPVVRRPRSVLADRRISENLVVVSGMIRWRSPQGTVSVARCSAKPSVAILDALFARKQGGVRLKASEIAQLRRNVRTVSGGDFVDEVLDRVRDEESLKGGPYYRVQLKRGFYRCGD